MTPLSGAISQRIAASGRGPCSSNRSWCHIFTRISGLCALLFSLSACDVPATVDYSGPTGGWSATGGTLEGQRFSPLTQINRGNVSQLEPAWEYRIGDISRRGEKMSSLQVTPIVVDDTMYLCSPFSRIIALQAETGEELWDFDPQVRHGKGNNSCRGVAYWRGTAEPSLQCSQRIFAGTVDGRLMALDALTGKPCEAFGDDGFVDLHRGLGEVAQGEANPTSPPIVLGDVVAIGSYVIDGKNTDIAGGGLRAYNAVDGTLLWVWDPVHPDADPVSAAEIEAGAIQTRSTANVWSLLSADSERGIIYAPTGNPSPDHYAGEGRDGLDFYGSSVVALEATTGRVLWHFQTVHHDIWDYDVPAQPTLFELGGSPGVLAATKMGHIFLLDRVTGAPLFPVEERPVPGGALDPNLSPTQPFPTHPAPVHPDSLTEADLNPLGKGECRELLASLRNEGIFTPPSSAGSIAYPGAAGGINWGSVSLNPDTGTLVVNIQRLPFIIRLLPRQDFDALEPDQEGFEAYYNPQHGTAYGVERVPFITSSGLPCTAPPWGELLAVDLNSGEQLWRRPFGTLNGQVPLLGKHIELGMPSFGGSIQTASGLIFIGAAPDQFLRAVDVGTGEELWRAELPFSAHSVPMTYRPRPDSKQIVAVAAGGHLMAGSPLGDRIIAFTLKE